MAEASSNEKKWKELRKAFPKGVVGKLPRVICRACSETQTRDCAQHHKSKCGECGNYITTAHIHLDYVGHAAVTDRLNETVGPENWTWEPLALDETGLPALDRKGNLWIRLTVLGVTRLGYGDGSDSIKELIGDALRNAAMRFGVALDLWTKEELESTLEDPSLKNDKPSNRASRPAVGSTPTEDVEVKVDRPEDAPATQLQRRQIKAYLQGLKVVDADMAGFLEENFGIIPGSTMTKVDAQNIIRELRSWMTEGGETTEEAA